MIDSADAVRRARGPQESMILDKRQVNQAWQDQERTEPMPSLHSQARSGSGANRETSCLAFLPEIGLDAEEFSALGCSVAPFSPLLFGRSVCLEE